MTYSEWTLADAARQIKVPTASDDKYSRGVLGIVTGSTDYPGAAVIGVEAALRTGVGMVRYLGPEVPRRLALARRPEIVTRQGRVQAWLLGSGIAAGARDAATVSRLTTAITQELPTVLDAGALELLGSAAGPTVITPHHGELSRMLGIDRSEITRDPAAWAARAADDLGVTVLLKGFRTHVADPYGTRLLVTSATSWTATAGTGDALGGILGSLLATHSAEIAATRGALAPLAATACVLHSLAAERASAGGPLTVLDLAAELSGVVARLLAAPLA
ncbi:hydroxyethylthiazole kinase-like uncharacterized protein yjeF [Marisediminicola sp. UYEF4]|uniref:ADP-dependent NAD(P)H-hydrate dehydratase n=1 Tax=Marisediminicola sp. UYEF4 TaxID=1756384 RepID=UPI003391A06F